MFSSANCWPCSEFPLSSPQLNASNPAHVVQTIRLDQGYFSRRSMTDWGFAALLLVAGGARVCPLRRQHGLLRENHFARNCARPDMGRLVLAPLARLDGGCCRTGFAGHLALSVDGKADLARADNVFLLKYFLSSQSAILWMSVLFFMSTVFYWAGVFSGGKASDMELLGSRLAWAAVALALVGTLVRWYEGHQMGPDIGHIPVSNLYEVFVLFCWMTALFYLYYEEIYDTRSLGAFVMLVVSAAVGFLIWYTVVREAHQIQPLIPALQSWWMKIHVPANFVGYGTFAIAAMVAFAYLIKLHAGPVHWVKLLPLWALGMVLCFEPMVFRQGKSEVGASYWFVYFGISALGCGGILAARQRIAARLPSFEVLDDVMYKAIAIGFAFFTIATVLGALWAADAWGGYWSWDPKETWALIVWLNTLLGCTCA
jgi:cytochrome c-type biogenesis protein CcsB